MSASKKEVIKVQFVMDEDGNISNIKDGDGNDAGDEDPTMPTSWASAVVATKNSPGKIYIWTGTRWKCIKAK